MSVKAVRILTLCLAILVITALGAGLFIRECTGTASAASFTYRVTPENGAVTQAKQPEIQFQLTLSGEKLESYQLYLDGQAMPAVYNPALGLISGQPPAELVSGRHNLKLTFVLAGFQPVEITSSFTVDGERYQPKTAVAKTGLLADGLKVLNSYRVALGLPIITEQPKLTQSAQAHADYLAGNKVFSHYQDKAHPGFAGVTVKDRAELFGYYLPVGEGLSTVAPYGGMGVDSLMDAPYHRLAHIDPNFTEAGMGFTLQPDCTVINYGAPQGLTDGRVVLYPYPGQTDAKIGWKAVESPNPLAAYGQEDTYVGYPISLSVHDSTTRELQVVSAQLTTAGGLAVPFFLVDSSKESSWKKHVFIIPQTLLTPGVAYTVRVEAVRLMTDGRTAPLTREWTFASLPRLEALSASMEQMDSGAAFVAVRVKNGDIADLEYTVTKGGEVWQAYQGGRYLRYNLDQPMTGKFTLELSSRLFDKPAVYELEITGAEHSQQVKIYSSTTSKGG
ncbi:CAP domain-containing protein [Sporomusa sp.]|uniref:CAP domain-containing protein n=1 Tax=Sporomusa sp. TaxID=2078658 RepID=UPI002CF2436F|nr:CAP domain-containing protein [Sporomusa sp.]HWR42918.1 CAP domain-containing protein [Sporomusa sp.]